MIHDMMDCVRQGCYIIVICNKHLLSPQEALPYISLLSPSLLPQALPILPRLVQRHDV